MISNFGVSHLYLQKMFLKLPDARCIQRIPLLHLRWNPKWLLTSRCQSFLFVYMCHHATPHPSVGAAQSFLRTQHCYGGTFSFLTYELANAWLALNEWYH